MTLMKALFCFLFQYQEKRERWYKLIQNITYLLVCKNKSIVSLKVYNSSETIKVNKERCDVLYICNFIKEGGSQCMILCKWGRSSERPQIVLHYKCIPPNLCEFKAYHESNSITIFYIKDGPLEETHFIPRNY